MGYVPIHRPVHYGVFLKLFSFDNSLWSIVIFQALLLSYLVYRFLPKNVRKTWYWLLGIYILLGFTGIPWYTSQIMPDVFGAYLLLSLLIIIQGKYSGYFDLIILSVICIFSMTTHKTNLLVLPVTIIVYSVLYLILFKNRRKFYVNFNRFLLPFTLALMGWLCYQLCFDYSYNKKSVIA